MIQRDPLYQYIELHLQQHRRQMAQRHSTLFRFTILHDTDRHLRSIVRQQPAVWFTIRDHATRALVRLGRWLEGILGSESPARCGDQR
jgi:hypothetical protein